MNSRHGRFLRMFGPIALVVCIVFLGYEQTQLNKYKAEQLGRLTSTVTLAAGRLNRDLELLRSDVNIIASSEALQRFLDIGTKANYATVTNLFEDISNNRRFYDQIRFIDQNGVEKIRIESVQGVAQTVPVNRLQDKSSRYYFQETTKLDRGETYVSPFDLNVEGGQVEEPHKPMIRVAQPVFDASGKKAGIVIFNYLGEVLLQSALDVFVGTGNRSYLLNADGHALAAPSEEAVWTFMFDGQKSFAELYPSLWDQLRNEDIRIIDGDDWLGYGQKVGFSEDLIRFAGPSKEQRKWTVLALVPASNFAFFPFLLSRPVTLLVLLAILTVVAVASYVLAAAKVREIQVLADLEDARRKAEAAQAVAESANKAKSRFLASMSHELRTPLNAVIGFSELLDITLAAHPETQKQRGYAGHISEGGRSLLTLVDDILDLARIENGTFDLSSVAFLLGEEFDNIASALSIKVSSNDVHFELHKPAEDRVVFGDPIRFRQVMFNVIGNAIKFTPGGRVTVRVDTRTQSDDRVRVKVEVNDTGIGIAPDKLKTIFDPFSRADESIARKFDGAGLGLSISRNLVRVMDGDIRVSSEEGKGSTFVVTTIFKDLSHVADSEEVLKNASRESVNFGLSILAVDDAPSNLTVLQHMLAEVGCDLTWVDSGEAAMASLRKSRPDLILMDIHMPEMDGIEAARRIHAQPEGATIPIVAWTADVLSQKRIETCGVRWAAKLYKPTTRKDLIQALREALGKEIGGNPKQATAEPKELV